MTNNTLTTLSRIDYVILATLYSLKAVDGLTSMTISELKNEGVELQRTAFYKHIHLLLELELVIEAGRDYKSKLYYISDKGIKLLERNEEVC